MNKKSLIILVTIICICVMGVGYIYENFYLYDDIKNLEEELSVANSMELWNKSEVVEDKKEIETVVYKLNNNIFSYMAKAYFVAKNDTKKLESELYVDKRKETKKYVSGWKEEYRICNSSERRCMEYIKYTDEKIIKDTNKSVVAEDITCTQGPYWTPLSSLIVEEGGYTIRKMYYRNKLYYVFGNNPHILLITDKKGIPLFEIECLFPPGPPESGFKHYEEMKCDTTQNAKIMAIYTDVNKDIDFGDVSWINEKNISVRELAANC